MTNGLSDAPLRLDALEMRIAHQDRVIGELNDVVTAQWRKIDLLERQIARLTEEWRNIGAQRDAPEPPPPHY